MSESNDDLCGRLGAVIEDWNGRIVQSHDALAQQITQARGHLDRLLQPVPNRGAGAEVAGDSQADTIAALEREVAALSEALEQAQASAPQMVGGPPPAQPENDEQLLAVRRDLEASEGVRETLRSELETVRAERDALREQQDAIDTEAAASDDETATLNESLNTAQAALVAAESRVATLEASLEAAQAELTEAKARCAELEASLAETDQGSQTLQEELEGLTARCATLESSLAEALENEKGATEGELAAANERCSALEATLAATEQDAQTLREELEAAREKCAALEASVAEAGDAAANEQELASLREQVASLSSDNAMAQTRVIELEELLAAAEDARKTSSRHVDGDVRIEAFDSQGHKKRMGEILLELGVLDEEQLKGILKEQSSDPQHRFGALVVQHGLTGEDIVAKILAAQLRLPYCDVQDMEIEEATLKLVSPHVNRLHRCLPLKEEDGVLTAAMVNPLDLIAIEDLELASSCRVSPVVSTSSQIEARLVELYGEASQDL